MNNKVIIFSAPSGAGKSTVVNHLCIGLCAVVPVKENCIAVNLVNKVFKELENTDVGKTLDISEALEDAKKEYLNK